MKDLKNSGRRAFLRGLGGFALALPLLELTHDEAWSQSTTAQTFVTFFAHGGVITNQGKGMKINDGNGGESGANLWAPADPGETLTLGTQLSPLTPYVDQLLLLQGLDNYATREQAQYGSGGHRLNNALALTVSDAQTGPDDHPRAGGPSIDFVIADLLAQANPTKFDRIHLYLAAHNYGSPYYSGAGQRVSGEKDPLVAFNTIFDGVAGDEGPSPEQLKQFAKRRSILDGVLASYNDAKSVVSHRDRVTIEAHLEHLYELEAELSSPAVQCTVPTIDDPGDNSPLIADLHVKIILAALRCGLTNVANLEMGDIITPWTAAGHPISQANIGHSLHKLQRSVGPTGADSNIYDAWLAEVTDNHQWRASIFGKLLEGLADPSFAQGDKTMLDNAVMLYTSEFSEGANHCGNNMPVLLAGKAGGQWNTGRHIDFRSTDPAGSSYDTEWSTHNVFSSILQAFGADDTSFGNDQAPHAGPLAGLTA